MADYTGLADEIRATAPTRGTHATPPSPDFSDLSESIREAASPGPKKDEPKGALARFGSGLYDTTIGPLVDLFTSKGAAAKQMGAQLLGTKQLSDIKDAVEKGDYGAAAAHALDYAQGPGHRIAQGIVEPTIQDVQQGNLAGAAGRVAGTAATLAVPAMAPEGAGEAAIAGLKAAAPDVAAGAGKVLAGAAVGELPGMGFLPRILLEYPGGRQIVKGVQKGVAAGKASLADRLKGAIQDAAQPAATAPAEDTNLLDGLAAGQTGKPKMTFAKLSQEDQATVRSLYDRIKSQEGGPTPAASQAPHPQAGAAVAQQPTAAPPSGPPPFQPKALLQAGPQVITPPAPPDASFVRAVPAEYPEVSPRFGPQPSPEPPLNPPPVPARSLAQTEAAMASKKPAPTDSPQSQFNELGERDSPQVRATKIENANRLGKAQRFAQVLFDQGTTPGDLAEIKMGHFSDSQIQSGVTPGWGNIATALGENEPSVQTISAIHDELRRLTRESKSSAASTPAKPATPSKSAPGGGMGAMKNYFTNP